MITTIFPPRNGVGALRTLKFAKYLGFFMWKPIIITPTVYLGRNEKPIIEKIPDRIIIYKTFWPTINNSLEWFRIKVISAPQQKKDSDIKPVSCKLLEMARLFGKKVTKIIFRVENNIKRYIFIDSYILWLPFALVKSLRIIKKEKIDVIYSTVPEFTSHIVGFCLKILTKKPWVADYRDIWSGGLFHPAWIFPAKLAAKIEKFILSRADAITVISEPMAVILEGTVKDKPKKIFTITNGFDPEDFSESPSSTGKNDKFTLVYTGTIYSYRYSLLEKFINALGALLADMPDMKNKMVVKFIGEISLCKRDIDKLTSLMQKFDLHNTVSFEKQVSHKESLQLQREADALLLLAHEGKDSKTVFTGKIFEYLASGRTIFAITPDNPAKDLIESANAGIVVKPGDPNEIKRSLLGLYQKWDNSTLSINPKREIIKEYDCRILTGRLAGVFNQIVIA